MEKVTWRNSIWEHLEFQNWLVGLFFFFFSFEKVIEASFFSCLCHLKLGKWATFPFGLYELGLNQSVLVMT